MRLRVAQGGIILWFVLTLMAIETRPASADYMPGAGPAGYTTVGEDGAKVQNQGSLNAGDAVNAWNAWTGQSKLSLGTTGCGTSNSCIIYVDEGQTLNSPMDACTADTILGTSSWAKAFQIWNGGANLSDPDCDSLSTDPDYPIFVIVLNTSLGLGSTAKLHIQRHEVGHAVGLGDEPFVECWLDYPYWSPLMNNGTQTAAGSCDGVYPANYTASYNEALYSAIRSGW
jgi:hypothetical protein